MTGIICGTGSYAPQKIMNNDDLAKLVDTNDQWIRERTGVVQRHIIEDETTVSMAVEAAKGAVEDAEINPLEIDLIIVSTISSNVILPCAACQVQRELGAVNATCFDLNAACSGFIFAYNTANAYIESGMYNTALVVGSESLSNLTDWTDRGTCILFGDGAGAAVIRKSESKAYKAVTHSDGNSGDALTCINKYAIKDNSDNGLMKMDGREVFNFAVKKVPEVIMEVLEKNNVALEEIDCFILHQANKRIVASVAKRLRVDIEKFPVNMMEYGNTSSASIPILIDELKKAGKLKKDRKYVMAGFGAGLSWGAAIFQI
jgi:3-oxoacyl-(acyl-carrier-protein) synthase III